MQRNLVFKLVGITWIATLIKLESRKTYKDGLSQTSIYCDAQTLDLAGTYQVPSYKFSYQMIWITLPG